jgi:hypothetical protein
MASPSTVHLIGFDIRTKEHILCETLRLCVRSLFTRTARTFVDIFVSRKGAKDRKASAGEISVCYAGWGGDAIFIAQTLLVSTEEQKNIFFASLCAFA